MKRTISTLLVTAVIAVAPDVLMACERCFGAGSDAPAVAAVSASMFALFVVMVGVFGGILSFFKNMNDRTAALADGQDSSPQTD